MPGPASQAARAWRPSTARRVALDTTLPLPRGASPTAPAPLAWPAKDPGDVLDYEVDASAALLGNDGDTIAGVTVLVQPPNELLPGQVFADGQTAIVWLSGGVAGTTYVVQVGLTTASGRTLGRAVLLPVQALATAVAPPANPGGAAAALATQAGVVVTDQNGAPILVNG